MHTQYFEGTNLGWIFYYILTVFGWGALFENATEPQTEFFKTVFRKFLNVSKDFLSTSDFIPKM